jgi:hypothetical protein
MIRHATSFGSFLVGFGLVDVIAGHRMLGACCASAGLAWVVRGVIDFRWFTLQLHRIETQIGHLYRVEITAPDDGGDVDVMTEEDLELIESLERLWEAE